MPLSPSTNPTLPEVTHITDAPEFFYIESLYSDMQAVGQTWTNLKTEIATYEANPTQLKQTHLHLQLRSFFESVKQACHMHRIRRGNDHEALGTFGIKFSQAIKRIYDRFTEMDNISSQQYLAQLLRENFPGVTFQDADFSRKMRDELIEKGKIRDTLRGIPASRPILVEDLPSASTSQSDTGALAVQTEAHTAYTSALRDLKMSSIPAGIEPIDPTQSIQQNDLEETEGSGPKLRVDAHAATQTMPVAGPPVQLTANPESSAEKTPDTEEAAQQAPITQSSAQLAVTVQTSTNISAPEVEPPVTAPTITTAQKTQFNEILPENITNELITAAKNVLAVQTPQGVADLAPPVNPPAPITPPAPEDGETGREEDTQRIKRPDCLTPIKNKDRISARFTAVVSAAMLLIIAGLGIKYSPTLRTRVIEFASAGTTPNSPALSTAPTSSNVASSERPASTLTTTTATDSSNLVGVNVQSKNFIRFRNNFKNRGQTDLSDGMDRFAASAIAEYKETDSEFQKRFNTYVAFLRASQVAPKPGHRGLAQVNKDYFANRLKSAEKFQKDVSSGKIADEDTLKKLMPESDDRNLFDAIDSTVAKSAPASIQDYNLELKGNEGYNNIVRDATAHPNQPLYRFYQEVLEEMKSTSLLTDNPADAADKFFQLARAKLGAIDEAGRAKYPIGSDVRGGLTYCIDTHERGIKRGDNNLVMKALSKFKPNPKKK